MVFHGRTATVIGLLQWSGGRENVEEVGYGLGRVNGYLSIFLSDAPRNPLKARR